MCLPTAPGCQLLSGDFGTSPFFGQLSGNKALDDGSHTILNLVWCLRRRMSLWVIRVAIG